MQKARYVKNLYEPLKSFKQPLGHEKKLVKLDRPRSAEASIHGTQRRSN